MHGQATVGVWAAHCAGASRRRPTANATNVLLQKLKRRRCRPKSRKGATPCPMGTKLLLQPIHLIPPAVLTHQEPPLPPAPSSSAPHPPHPPPRTPSAETLHRQAFTVHSLEAPLHNTQPSALNRKQPANLLRLDDPPKVPSSGLGGLGAERACGSDACAADAAVHSSHIGRRGAPPLRRGPFNTA